MVLGITVGLQQEEKVLLKQQEVKEGRHTTQQVQTQHPVLHYREEMEQ
jgi:hypothetical protein